MTCILIKPKINHPLNPQICLSELFVLINAPDTVIERSHGATWRLIARLNNDNTRSMLAMVFAPFLCCLIYNERGGIVNSKNGANPQPCHLCNRAINRKIGRSCFFVCWSRRISSSSPSTWYPSFWSLQALNHESKKGLNKLRNGQKTCFWGHFSRGGDGVE